MLLHLEHKDASLGNRIAGFITGCNKSMRNEIKQGILPLGSSPPNNVFGAFDIRKLDCSVVYYPQVKRRYRT